VVRVRPVAGRPGIGHNLDLVARRAGHRVPADDGDFGLVPRSNIHVGTRVGEVVAHPQVLDARARDRAGRRDLVERLGERLPLVPDARVAVGVEGADSPVEDVVLEDLRRRERGGDAGAAAADLRARREVGGGVDLDLVTRCPRDRIPGEAWVVGLRRGVQILEVGRSRGGPEPVERGHGSGDAAVPLGIHRHDAPVIGAGRQRRGDGGRVGGDVRRASGVVLIRVVQDERAEGRVARDGDQVVRSPGYARPVEDDGIRRETERRTRARALERRLQVPLLAERARLRPGRDLAGSVRRAHTPVVRPVRDCLEECRARVAREEVVLARTQDRRVHAGVGADLELILVRALDGRPGHGGEELDYCTVGGRDLHRTDHRGPSRAGCEEGDCREGGCEESAV